MFIFISDKMCPANDLPTYIYVYIIAMYVALSVNPDRYNLCYLLQVTDASMFI